MTGAATARFIGVALALGLLAHDAPGHAAPARLAPIPGGIVARATGDIVEAELIGATGRYRHFVLGSRYEASGLRVRIKGGRILELILPEDAVFEDRRPRIADLDGDKRNEIVLVISRQSTGSALAVIGVRDGGLKILAETTPNGAPQRWLNPAGIGHFLGNGRRQVALVRMPHAVGRLEFWDFDGSALTLHGSLEDTSNHRIGSDRTRLSTVIARGAGRTDLLALPSFDRRRLRIIEAVPQPHEIASVALEAPVVGDFLLRRNRRGVRIRVPLEGGQSRQIVLPASSLR